MPKGVRRNQSSFELYIEAVQSLEDASIKIDNAASALRKALNVLRRVEVAKLAVESPPTDVTKPQ